LAGSRGGLSLFLMMQTLFFLVSASPKIRHCLSRLWHEDQGQDLVEYSLLMVLVALGVTAATDRLGDYLYFTFRRIAIAVTHKGFYER